MVVWSVKVDEPAAEALQCSEGGRASVHKLPVGAGGGDHTLEQQLPLFAGFDANFAQCAVELMGGSRFENRLDCAGVRARPDE